MLQFTTDEYESALERAKRLNLPALKGSRDDVEKAIVIRDRLFSSLSHEMSGFYAFALVMDVHDAEEYTEYDHDTLRRILLRRIARSLPKNRSSMINNANGETKDTE